VFRKQTGWCKAQIGGQHQKYARGNENKKAAE
jgi:hypothetical protein